MRRATWFLRKGRYHLENRSAMKVEMLRWHFSPTETAAHRGTPSLFVQAANLWYDTRDTYIVRFVGDGCRKNLPLSDAA